MRSRLPKILTVVFLFFIILQTSAFLYLNLFYSPAQADGEMPEWTMPELQITIPGMEEFTEPSACPDDPSKKCVPWIGQYIAGVYKYAIGIVGILAAVVLMFGGVLWLTAGGNAERVGNAKSWIGASLTGLVLALCSYMVLYQINPKLTQFKPIKVAVVSDKSKGCCEHATGCESDILKSDCEKKDGYIAWTSDSCEKNNKCACANGKGTLINGGTATIETLCQQHCGDKDSTVDMSESSGGRYCCVCIEEAVSEDLPNCSSGIIANTGTPNMDKAKNECSTKCQAEGKIYEDIDWANSKISAVPPVSGLYCCKCAIDCTIPANNGKICGTNKVCDDNSCKSCEDDIGGWCSSDVCCPGMCCEQLTGFDKCKTGTPTNGKYCSEEPEPEEEAEELTTGCCLYGQSCITSSQTNCLAVSGEWQGCSTCEEEPEPEECEGADEGTSCSGGYCYGGTCLSGKGSSRNSCGNDGGSTCFDGTFYNPCPGARSLDAGGRDCESGLYCCTN